LALPAILSAALLTIGCAGIAPQDLSSGEGLGGSSLRPAEPLPAATLYPPIEITGLIERTPGHRPPGGPRTLRYHEQATDPHQWQHHLDGVRTRTLTRTQDGAILITSETELAEAVVVTYTPPMVMLPAQVAMNQPIRSKTRMAVHRLSNGSLQDHGWCQYQVELLGTQKIITPTGTREAYIVRTQRQIDLKLAQVRVTSLAAYVPDQGWVAEKIERITKPLRLFEIKQTETLRLVH